MLHKAAYNLAARAHISSTGSSGTSQIPNSETDDIAVEKETLTLAGKLGRSVNQSATNCLVVPTNRYYLYVFQSHKSIMFMYGGKIYYVVRNSIVELFYTVYYDVLNSHYFD